MELLEGVTTIDVADRAMGCLIGMSVGDAMGMPTQMQTRSTVRERYGYVAGFLPGPEDNWISRGEESGRVTDDTEQAFVIAEALVRAHQLDRGTDLMYLSTKVAEELVTWFTDNRKQGEDFLGPSSRRAIESLQRGVDVRVSGRWGDTNGASMRIAPIGIAYRPGPGLLDAVEAVSRPTHNTGLAMSGAALVATVISSELEGASLDDAIDQGLAAAEKIYTRGHYVAGALVTARTRRTMAIASQVDRQDARAVQAAADHIADEIGTGVQTQEAVPTAVGFLYLRTGDPWAAILDATNAGGDADTIAAITGAMGGALRGTSGIPTAIREQLDAVNHLPIHDRAAQLLAIRSKQ